MKKVTIPTCANPFVVIVNGIKYTYPAGETVEVPDDVAAVIEQHHDAHNNPQPAPVVPPFVPSEGGNSGGGLPIVEIDTAPDENGEQILLSEADSAKLDEISVSHENCFMRIFGLDGYKYLVPMALTAGDIDGFQIKIWGGSYLYGGIGIITGDGGWIMALIPANGD